MGSDQTDNPGTIDPDHQIGGEAGDKNFFQLLPIPDYRVFGGASVRMNMSKGLPAWNMHTPD
jgi:hypothetical protein